MQYCKFIDEYLKYTKNTETPELLHIWCAISAIAGAAERKIWLDRGMFQLFSNFFIVLIGPPGVVAKTTSISFMARLLNSCGCSVVDQVATKEKIICEMAEQTKWFKTPSGKKFPHSSITFAMSELNTLLTAGQDMVLFLTALWDKYDVYKYKTKTSGEFEIINPYFNMIGAATPDWFTKAIDNDLLSTGFLARCILVYASNKRGKFPKPFVTDEQVIAKNNCIDILDWVMKQYGEIEVTEEAEKCFSDWYVNLPDHYSKDPKLGGYFERKARVFVLKLAMVIALGNKRMRMIANDVKMALDIFDLTEPALKVCYMLTGSNKLAPFVRALLRIVLDAGGEMNYVKILQHFYNDITTDELAQVLSLLRNMNLIGIEGSKVTIINEPQAYRFIGEY